MRMRGYRGEDRARAVEDGAKAAEDGVPSRLHNRHKSLFCVIYFGV